MLGRGDTDGVFQLESAGMRRVLTDLQPENLEDIIAVISLYRPGPMQSIPRFIAGKKDPSSVQYRSPILENVARCDLRLHGLSGTGHADRAGCGGLFPRPQRHGAPRHGQEKARPKWQKEKKVFVEGAVDADGNVVVPGAVRNGAPARTWR